MSEVRGPALVVLAMSALLARPDASVGAERAAVGDVEYEVPEGFSLSKKQVAGPGGGLVAFLVPKLWCAADARREIAASLRLGAFDAAGRLLWDAKAAGTLEIREMFIQRDGRVIVWGWHLEKVDGATRSSVLFRFGRGGLDRSFETLAPGDLGDLRLTSVAVAADDTIAIEGNFTSVRGQPRSGKARLGPDGSLEE